MMSKSQSACQPLHDTVSSSTLGSSGSANTLLAATVAPFRKSKSGTHLNGLGANFSASPDQRLSNMGLLHQGKDHHDHNGLSHTIMEEEEELRDEEEFVPEQHQEDALSRSWLCSTPFLLFILWLSSMGEVYFPDLMNESQMNYWNFKYNADLADGKKRTFPLRVQNAIPGTLPSTLGTNVLLGASGTSHVGSSLAALGQQRQQEGLLTTDDFQPAQQIDPDADTVKSNAPPVTSQVGAGPSQFFIGTERSHQQEPPASSNSAASLGLSAVDGEDLETTSKMLKSTLLLAWFNTCQDEVDCKISIQTDKAYKTGPMETEPTSTICHMIRPAKGERLELDIFHSKQLQPAVGASIVDLQGTTPGTSTGASGSTSPLALGGSKNPISHFHNMGRLVEQTAGAKSDLEKCVAKIEYVMRENPEEAVAENWVNTKMIARPMHLFSFLIHRLGNVMVLIFKPSEARTLHKQNWGLAAGPAICEGLAQICLFTGIVLSCAQLKTIIYCSGSVWSALGCWLFLQKKLNTWQIIGMLLVILGLMAKSKSSFDVITKSGGSDVLAIVLMLAGTILHSLTNVFNQKILQACNSDTIKPIPAASLAVMIGIISCFLYSFYFAGWVWPEFSDIVVEPIKVDKYDLAVIGSVGLLIASWLHAAAFFFLLGNIGVVSCSMVKGAQTGTYVMLSHFLWCDYEKNPKQCIDTYTGIATVLSILGVLVYSYASVYCVPTPSVPETEIEKVEELKVPRSVYQSQDGRSITVYSKADKQRTSSVYSISMNHVVDEQALTAALSTTRSRSRLGSVELENMEEDLLDDCKKV